MSKPSVTQPLSDPGLRERERTPVAEQLVGLDGSEGSLHALRWAAARTEEFGPVQPLTTWSCPWWSFTGPMPPPAGEFKRSAEKRALAALNSIPSNRHLPLIICQGHAGSILADVGARSGLIVVGTRGRSGLADTLLGSVSSHVVANATRPVAVVPAGAPIDDVHRRVVVGVDGSANSIGALLWAFEHTPSDSIIEAVHSWIYPASALPDMAMNPRTDFESGAKITLDDTVAAALKATHRGRGRAPEATVVKRLEYGDPRRVLRECQADSDLLVVGARGRGIVSHLLLGSVASALIHQPRTTMVVVPAAHVASED